MPGCLQVQAPGPVQLQCCGAAVHPASSMTAEDVPATCKGQTTGDRGIEVLPFA